MSTSISSDVSTVASTVTVSAPSGTTMRWQRLPWASVNSETATLGVIW